MYLLIDNSYSGSFEDKVREVWTEEDEIQSFIDNYPAYKDRGWEIYAIDGNNRTVKRVKKRNFK